MDANGASMHGFAVDSQAECLVLHPKAEGCESECACQARVVSVWLVAQWLAGAGMDIRTRVLTSRTSSPT